MNRFSLLLILLLIVVACREKTEYTGLGKVVAIDELRLHVTIDHEDIPGLTSAMTMRLAAASPTLLAGIEPGSRVRFTLRQQGKERILTSLTLVSPDGSPARSPDSASRGVTLHDHTPHHGGIVGMAGSFHVEAAAASEGVVKVYLTDFWRTAVPLEGVTGTVTLGSAARESRLKLLAVGDVLTASGAPIPGAEVDARVELTVNGDPIEIDFMLPLSPEASGAAGVPTKGCVPPDERATQSRHPRCTLTFAHPVSTLAVAAGQASLLVAAANLGVSAWRMPTGDLRFGFAPPPPVTMPGLERSQAHLEVANAIAVSPDGTEALVTLEGRLLRYAVGTGRLIRELPAMAGVVRSAAWSPDGKSVLVTVFYDPAAHLLRAEDGAEIRRIYVEREGAAAVFAPVGGLAAVGSEAGPITIFDTIGGSPERVLTGSHSAINALAFSTESGAPGLVSASNDGSLRLWDPYRGALLDEGQFGRPLLTLAIPARGGVVASGGLDGRVRIHQSNLLVETLDWHSAPVVGLAWAGSVLVSGDSDGLVALWDLGDRLPAR